MNGPIKMYQIRQIIRHDLPVELPNCMYKMKNLLPGCKINSSSEHVSSAKKNLDILEQVNIFLKNQQTHPEMANLLAKQEIIIKQINELREQLLSLQKYLNSDSNNTATIKSSCTQNIKLAEEISKEVQNESDLVINISPTSNPPYSLLILQKLWAHSVQIVIRSYLHSSVVNVPKAVRDFEASLNKSTCSNSSLPTLLIRLIWKEGNENMELITSSSLNMPIFGEVNICRYLSRVGPISLNYEKLQNVNEIDSALDICHTLSSARTKTERHTLLQSLNGLLGKSQWLCNSNQNTIADIVACSILKHVSNSEINVNLSKWLKRCETI